MYVEKLIIDMHFVEAHHSERSLTMHLTFKNYSAMLNIFLRSNSNAKPLKLLIIIYLTSNDHRQVYVYSCLSNKHGFFIQKDCIDHFSKFAN